jgi:hypothetical protein
MTAPARTQLDGFEFIGAPFDPRPSVRGPQDRPARITALLARARAMATAAHASALDAQVQLQRRSLSGLGGRP